MKMVFTNVILTPVILVCLLVSCDVGLVMNDSPDVNQDELAALLSSKGLTRDDVLDLTQDSDNRAKSGRFFRSRLEIVTLKGKVNHFGYDITQSPPAPIDYHATVPDVRVWIAEYPFTRWLRIKTNDTGRWRMYVLKFRGCDLEFSFIYEKDGWITTKSNAIPIGSEDNLDLAIQFIDPLYFNLAVKPGIEGELSALLGFPVSVNNGVVVTVGKSWASIHDDRLPHGDPGAQALINPPIQFPTSIGPIYFNEFAQPDPLYTSTSLDGGVAWLNLPVGDHRITASKAPFEYSTAKFRITEADIRNGVQLYIASPPDSVQGTNDSGPGLP